MMSSGGGAWSPYVVPIGVRLRVFLPVFVLLLVGALLLLERWTG